MIALIVAFVVSLPTLSPSASPSPSSPAIKGLLVYGDDWWFSVQEPVGWHGDTQSFSQANIVFYRSAETWKTSTTIMWIQVMPDDGPDVAGDLTADMEHWKQKYPAIQFQDLVAPHPQYKSFGQVYLVPGEDPSYAVYLDPGPKTKYYFIVTMQPEHRAATPEELAVFRGLVASIILGGSITRPAP